MRASKVLIPCLYAGEIGLKTLPKTKNAHDNCQKTKMLKTNGSAWPSCKMVHCIRNG